MPSLQRRGVTRQRQQNSGTGAVVARVPGRYHRRYLQASDAEGGPATPPATKGQEAKWSEAGAAAARRHASRRAREERACPNLGAATRAISSMGNEFVGDGATAELQR